MFNSISIFFGSRGTLFKEGKLSTERRLVIHLLSSTKDLTKEGFYKSRRKERKVSETKSRIFHLKISDAIQTPKLNKA